MASPEEILGVSICLRCLQKRSFVQYTPQTEFALLKMIDIAGFGGIMSQKQHLAFASMLFWCVALTVSPIADASRNAADGSMTTTERRYLLDELKSSEAGLLSAIKGLTQAQWTFKPKPDAWSVQECTEHLILAEDLIFNEAQEVLATPSVSRLPNATPEGDRQVVGKWKTAEKKRKHPKFSNRPTDLRLRKVRRGNSGFVARRLSRT
jgi:DinB superfamily